MKSTINHAFSIKILILVFFLVGLENITLPPIDAHDWRQTLTLSIAHNFLDHSNIFYPRMDIGGQGDGIMACEFPIFNYLLAGIFKIFGPHDWYGRLLNWTISCAGLCFFYELVRKSSNARVAFFASIALMGSVVFEYARKSMPDTFALFTTMAGVWFLWRYIERGALKYLILGFILTVCGILSKIPFLVLLSFL
ncbi:MAG: glycosyltransferase family 39 protein, partial [Saprospiraceae bacterium]|nr:glycosyltransferase family 39 protein [Saprospiraceae bacterium]